MTLRSFSTHVAASLMAAVILAGCGGGAGGDEGSDRDSGNSSVRPSVTLKAPSSVPEGSRSSREYSYVVNLSSSSDEEIRVTFETEDGTAIAGEDYHATSGELVFKPSERRKEIPVLVVADDKDEPDENFTVRLTSVTTNATMSSTDRYAVSTITDDDRPPTVGYLRPQQVVAETVGEIAAQVILSTESGYEVVVPFTATGTAQVDQDYTLGEERTVTFAPGETAKPLPLTVLTDTIPEGGETVVLQLGQPQNATLPEDPLEARHVVTVSGDVALNDTGVSAFSNGSDFSLAVEPASHPGQDASRGRDVTAAHMTDGALGFSFTKLDQHGNPLDPSALNWSCVRDNTTGLVWEAKSAPTDPMTADASQWRAGNYVYTWYRSDNTNNGGNNGALNDQFPSRTYGTSECSYSDNLGGLTRRHTLRCNTEVYAQEMNLFGACGFKDWRLPTVTELRSIYQYQSDQTLAQPDSDFFPYHAAGAYLSGTPSADNDASVWCVGEQGTVQLCHKGIATAVRMVRKGE